MSEQDKIDAVECNYGGTPYFCVECEEWQIVAKGDDNESKDNQGI